MNETTRAVVEELRKRARDMIATLGDCENEMARVARLEIIRTLAVIADGLEASGTSEEGK